MYPYLHAVVLFEVRKNRHKLEAHVDVSLIYASGKPMNVRYVLKNNNELRVGYVRLVQRGRNKIGGVPYYMPRFKIVMAKRRISR